MSSRVLFPRFKKAEGRAQKGRNSTDELVQDIPQDSETTELQVPPRVQVPATADRPTLSLGFRPAGDVGCGVTGSTHSTTGCPSEQTCWRSPPFSRLYLFQTASYLTNYTSSKDATLTSTTSRTVATLTTATLKIVTLPTANEQTKQREL